LTDHVIAHHGAGATQVDLSEAADRCVGSHATADDAVFAVLHDHSLNGTSTKQKAIWNHLWQKICGGTNIQQNYSTFWNGECRRLHVSKPAWFSRVSRKLRES
jgi:hypothetical protein